MVSPSSPWWETWNQAGRHSTRTVPESLYHTSKYETKEENLGMNLWKLKPIPGNTLPRPRLQILLKESTTLGTKYLNTCAYKDRSHSHSNNFIWNHPVSLPFPPVWGLCDGQVCPIRVSPWEQHLYLFLLFLSIKYNVCLGKGFSMRHINMETQENGSEVSQEIHLLHKNSVPQEPGNQLAQLPYRKIFSWGPYNIIWHLKFFSVMIWICHVFLWLLSLNILGWILFSSNYKDMFGIMSSK